MKLIQLSGKANQQLFDIDVDQLDPVDKGIVVLSSLARLYPGLTWGQLAELVQYPDPRMLGIGDWLGRQWNRVTTGAKDGLDYLGDKFGETVRLLSDKEVMDAVKSYGSAYATSGSSLAAEGFLDKLFGGQDMQEGQAPILPDGKEAQKLVETLLASFGGEPPKDDTEQEIPRELLWGGLALTGVVLVLGLAQTFKSN